ncbi:hypothetical protein J3R30DRAFT_3563965 [Lentinula aciculospora]|uniref:Uncharacterized protein n=1 Tax=Lentinula aciculospora TaxID=153920 RepID=A0A9W8ZVX9_9AGAR|nr:hypothetical protein J3R30DRAFT_3563853 [Lentinula aciculospora]KAJ4467816.1 hypothetical protein J3R30DRAFT_3563896 [Lentinula aciculospora]KAJ4467821.1 hypothetical protein J3R30DRAFT_3563965 [Lentinula aciculospora]
MSQLWNSQRNVAKTDGGCWTVTLSGTLITFLCLSLVDVPSISTERAGSSLVRRCLVCGAVYLAIYLSINLFIDISL